jgi:UDP:flavonoid glycosyltransferase YjiC (YdhE family)
VISWLDKQPVASVIYIAFGSAIRLPPSAIETVAHALSNHSFIWSLKTKLSLPLSLKNLDSNRQLILEWTPQRAILAHPSISFFFSHGGWNSLIEGMLHGQAILAWPFFADQFDNTLQLVDMGIAEQVSTDLQSDIEHMFTNRSYATRAKQIQKMVINAQEITSKEQIADIVRLISNEEKEHDEF